MRNIRIPLGPNPERYTVVDREDADLLNLRWHYNKKGSVQNTRELPWGWQTTILSRVVMMRVLGRMLARGEHVYHFDRNPLNNCRSNLYVVRVSGTRGAERSGVPSGDEHKARF